MSVLRYFNNVLQAAIFGLYNWKQECARESWAPGSVLNVTGLSLDISPNLKNVG